MISLTLNDNNKSNKKIHFSVKGSETGKTQKSDKILLSLFPEEIMASKETEKCEKTEKLLSAESIKNSCWRNFITIFKS